MKATKKAKAEMKVEMSSTNRLILAMLGLAAIAALFWTQLLSPKREEANRLSEQVAALEASLSQHEAEAAQAEAAKADFPADYRRLVVLGKAVPGDDDMASLLVQINRISQRAGGTFRNIQLNGGGGEAAAPQPTAAGSEAASPTEVAASLMPLGATVGPAGLAVMPYEVTFYGGFFEIADFIKGLDELVETGKEEVTVDGRLVTIDGFSLEADPDRGFPALQASFSLTTFLTPPAEDGADGATLGSPVTVTPAATTTGGGG